MTGPDDKAAAGRGHLRAAHVDREHVIEVLKVAFVQGRLTGDELEARTAQAITSKTYADLAALTADIPSAPADILTLPDDRTGSGALRASGTPARTLGTAARRSGVCLITAVALLEGAFLTGQGLLIILAFFAFMAVTGFMGYGIVDARQERRSRGQLPSQPGHDGRGLRDGRSARPGPDPALPDHRTDHTRTDLRAHRTRTDLRAHRTRGPRPRHPLWYSNTYRGVFGHRGVYWVLWCTCAGTHPVVSRPWSRSAGWSERAGRSSAP
jgi:hypothetical protein